MLRIKIALALFAVAAAGLALHYYGENIVLAYDKSLLRGEIKAVEELAGKDREAAERALQGVSRLRQRESEVDEWVNLTLRKILGEDNEASGGCYDVSSDSLLHRAYCEAGGTIDCPKRDNANASLRR